MKTGFGAFLKALFIGATFFALTSCVKQGNPPSVEQEDLLTHVQKTGVIEACTIIDPPYVIKDAKTGELSGVYIDAAKIIANYLNAKINWHETTFGTAVADLSSHRCDLLVSSLVVTIPRASQVAFTEPPLTYIGLSALVRANDKRFQHVTDPFLFDKPDITVVVATGEMGDFWVKDNFIKAKVKRIDVEASDVTRFGAEVSSGRADVAIAGSDDIGNYAIRHPETKDLFKDNEFSMHSVGWTVRRGDPDWLHFIETSLNWLEAQGTMDRLEKKYNAHIWHIPQHFVHK